MVTTVDPIPIEYRSLIRYNQEWQALICLKCDGHAAVGRATLGRHLHDAHGLSAKDYKPLIKALDTSGVSPLPSLDDFPNTMLGSDCCQGVQDAWTLDATEF